MDQPTHFRGLKPRRMVAYGAFGAMVALFVHSLLYSAFFEDPFMWFLLALTMASLPPERVRSVLGGSVPASAPAAGAAQESGA
jgi:hypothetical protein